MKNLKSLVIIPLLFLTGCGINSAADKQTQQQTNQKTQQTKQTEADAKPEITKTEDEEVEEQPIDLALIAIDGTTLANKLKTETIGCNDKIYLIANNNPQTPEQALEDLFTHMPQNKDAYNSFLGSTLTIDDITVENKVAKLHLSGELRPAGTCDNPRITSQINTTLEQYNGIDSVETFINNEPINDYLSEK